MPGGSNARAVCSRRILPRRQEKSESRNASAAFSRSRHSAGVTVAGVMDDQGVDSNQGTEFDLFVQSGLDLRRDGNPGLMHHKIIIIDHSIVVTGSYNITGSADERNDENVIIFFSPDIAEFFFAEFERVFGTAQQP